MTAQAGDGETGPLPFPPSPARTVRKRCKMFILYWTNSGIYDNIISAENKQLYNGVWLSLVERYVRDVEAAGSNPVTPIE